MGSIFSLQKKKNCTGEFSCGAAGKESGIVTVAAWGAAVTWVWSLTQDLSYDVCAAKKKKKIILKYNIKLQKHLKIINI